mmetsp:Transcript_15359/g.22491  ORF Transcript_15359/g.22491 Transcript_15359/m.22491 type:complete len:125 (-) Transcript_15359:251-625(-)
MLSVSSPLSTNTQRVSNRKFSTHPRQQHRSHMMTRLLFNVCIQPSPQSIPQQAEEAATQQCCQLPGDIATHNHLLPPYLKCPPLAAELGTRFDSGGNCNEHYHRAPYQYQLQQKGAAGVCRVCA